MSTTTPLAPKTSGLAIASLVCGILFCVPCLSVLAIVLGILALSGIAKSNGTVVGGGFAKAGIALGVITLLLQIIAALLAGIPLVMAYQDVTLRTSSQPQLKQISLAVLNHESINNRFAAAGAVDSPLRPKLSWRVQILPFLEQSALYDQFNQNEAWDGPTNKKLISQMPKVYHVSYSNLPQSEGKTCVQLAVGQQTLFAGAEPARYSDLVDGASNTVMLVVTDDEHAVTWTAPDDYDVANLPIGLLNRADASPLIFFDGSVQNRRVHGIDANDLRGYFTPAGNEVLEPLE